jgi:hypothetical protein
MIDKTYFKKTFGNLLKEMDFKSKGRSWYIDGLDSVVVLNIQKSDFDDRYYLNFGIWLKALGTADFPAENKCHIQGRLTSLFPEDVEIIEMGCRINVDNEENFIQLLTLIRTKIVSFFMDCLQNDSLKAKLLKGDFKKSLVMKDVKDILLGI